MLENFRNVLAAFGMFMLSFLENIKTEKQKNCFWMLFSRKFSKKYFTGTTFLLFSEWSKTICHTENENDGCFLIFHYFCFGKHENEKQKWQCPLLTKHAIVIFHPRFNCCGKFAFKWSTNHILLERGLTWLHRLACYLQLGACIHVYSLSCGINLCMHVQTLLNIQYDANYSLVIFVSHVNFIASWQQSYAALRI